MARGDHIWVERFGGIYSHHGIDCGDGYVIHYAGNNGWSMRVNRDQLEVFAGGGDVLLRDYSRVDSLAVPSGNVFEDARREWNRTLDRLRGLPAGPVDLSPDRVMERAESRLGETNFDLAFNNCEHFASWCKTGVSESHQIEALWRSTMSPTAYFQRRFSATLRSVIPQARR